MKIKPNMYLSTCGKYIAIRNETYDYDVLAVDGSRIWLWGRYRALTFNEPDPRAICPEFPFMVSSFSNYSYTNRAGRYIEDFELGFGEYDTRLKIDPLTGNTEINHQTARFMKPIYKLTISRSKGKQE